MGIGLQREEQGFLFQVLILSTFATIGRLRIRPGLPYQIYLGK